MVVPILELPTLGPRRVHPPCLQVRLGTGIPVPVQVSVKELLSFTLIHEPFTGTINTGGTEGHRHKKGLTHSRVTDYSSFECAVRVLKTMTMGCEGGQEHTLGLLGKLGLFCAQYSLTGSAMSGAFFIDWKTDPEYKTLMMGAFWNAFVKIKHSPMVQCKTKAALSFEGELFSLNNLNQIR